jgi:hypothetical protein
VVGEVRETSANTSVVGLWPVMVGVAWSTSPGSRSSTVAAFRPVGDGRVRFHRGGSFTVCREDDSPRELDRGWLWKQVHVCQWKPCSSEGELRGSSEVEYWLGLWRALGSSGDLGGGSS